MNKQQLVYVYNQKQALYYQEEFGVRPKYLLDKYHVPKMGMCIR